MVRREWVNEKGRAGACDDTGGRELHDSGRRADDAPAAGPRSRGVGPWDTFHGDSGRTGNSSGDGPLSNHVLRSNNTGGNDYSSPVVAGDRVFIGSVDRNLYCFNATTGKRLWMHNTGNGIQSSQAVTENGTRVIEIGRASCRERV